LIGRYSLGQLSIKIIEIPRRKQKMIRSFPVAIAATILALSLTASASMAEDEQLSQVAEQLKTALAADPVEVTQKAGSVTLTSSTDAMFPSGGWQVPSNAPLLDKMLPTLSKLQHTKVVVSGYTDNVPVGAELQTKGVSSNLDLSAERAVAIANYLTSHGVKPDLVSAHAFGETRPVASNDTPEGRAKNRRVDITLTGAPACAWERVLLDTNKAAENWQITSEDLGLKLDRPFSVRMRVLHGGRQEGVSIVDIDTGAMRISVVPTRGMNVLEAVAGDVRIGWRSPVSEVVNPAFIELNGRGGLGWLEGFNEMVTRCGYEWVGHPGIDKSVMLPLHGLAANIPASKVVLCIDQEPPYTIRLKGDLKEQAFKLVNFVIATELSTEAGAQQFSLHDTLTNQGDYPKEYEALYHSNFGPPLLDPGAGFSAPVQQVSPFNDRAAPELSDYQTYKPPTRDYDETVFNVVPYGDERGDTLAVLHNAAGSLGISLGFNIQQLPVFSLWKNTDTLGQGYVTGLEPGTSWAYNRSYQRALNRVPTIGPKEQRRFDITYTFLPDKAAVDRALQRVKTIQQQRPTEMHETPLVALPKQ
jgi:outer membrane protein OmpA-like peptidoglycan-associated protein